MEWKPETLAAVAGALQQSCPRQSVYEIISVVWPLARMESPRIGGLRLLYRARSQIQLRERSTGFEHEGSAASAGSFSLEESS